MKRDVSSAWLLLSILGSSACTAATDSGAPRATIGGNAGAAQAGSSGAVGSGAAPASGSAATGGASSGTGGASSGSGGASSGSGGASSGSGGASNGSGASSGRGGASAGSGGAPGGAGGTSACTDEYPYNDGFSCAEQAQWGKCGETWLVGYCNKSCGRCTDTGTGGASTGTGGAGAANCGISPVDPLASAATRALLCYLHNRTGHDMVSGQTDLADADWVYSATGKYPAIVGLDFMRVTPQMGNQTGDTATAISWWRDRGGLVTYQWHWVSPTGATNLGSGFYTNSTSFDLAAALSNTNSAEYQGLITDMDAVATELAKMRDAGVPILFRPLHEAQGGWFWWGAKGAGPCKALYSILFDRFTRVHGLHNILWVWVAYPSNSGKGNPADWYPGNDRVDLVASDYEEEPRDYTELFNLSGGAKPVVLAETMDAPDPDRAIANGTPWAYWVTWARRDWNANSGSEIVSAYANPHTIALDALPDVQQW